VYGVPRPYSDLIAVPTSSHHQTTLGLTVALFGPKKLLILPALVAILAGLDDVTSDAIRDVALYCCLSTIAELTPTRRLWVFVPAVLALYIDLSHSPALWTLETPSCQSRVFALLAG
jgi:hypothetical protein